MARLGLSMMDNKHGACEQNKTRRRANQWSQLDSFECSEEMVSCSRIASCEYSKRHVCSSCCVWAVIVR